jgi:hypothetical protein
MHLSRFRPRFTVRQLMVAVAIVAVLWAFVRWAGEMWLLSQIHHEQAQRLASLLADHKSMSEAAKNNAQEAERDPISARRRFLSNPDDPDETSRDLASEWRSAIIINTKYIKYYEQLKMNYERAARYPWFPVDPDPPKPE